MKQTIKYILLVIGIGLSFGLIVSAAPTQTFQVDLFPAINNQYQLGSSTRQWLRISSQNASTTDATISGTAWINNLTVSGTISGVVTSVGMTVPTGLTVSGSPITSAGTLALGLDPLYNIPLTASTTNWNNFFTMPSTQITGGTNLTWSGNTLNVDDPFTVTTLNAGTLTISSLAVSPLIVGGTATSTIYGNTGQYSILPNTTITNASTTYLTVGSNIFLPNSVITNSNLVNSSLTVNGTAISLGSSGTVTAAAGTLTGTTLNSTVVSSSLTSVGTLTGLSVNGGYTQTGTTANTFTGTPTFSNATYSALFTGGNVGIGTTSPGSLLSVNSTGNVYFGGNLTVSGTANSIGTTTMNGFNICTSNNGVCAGAGLTGTTGQVAYFSGTNTAVGTSTIFISTAGNVGIGTTSPQVALAVAQNKAIQVGPAYLSSGGDYVHLANNEWFNGTSWVSNGVVGGLLQISGQAFSYYTHNGAGTHTQLLTILSSGNVGINVAQPSYKLDVNGTVRLATLGDNGTSAYYICIHTTTSQITRGASCDSSDVRLKKDITPTDNARLFADFLQLKPVTFNWIDPLQSTSTQLGLIAQDVEKIFPQFIFTGDNGYKALQYQKLIVPAIAAIKELASTTVSLESRIANLESRINATSTLQASQGTFNLSTMSSDLNLNGFSILNVKSITGMNGLWRIDEGGNITAQSVETQKLTVGGGAASGVTIYDRTSGAPTCIYIEGGVIKTSGGACGTTTNAGKDLEGIDTNALNALLIKGMQEQQKEIEDLRERIKVLENK